MPFLPKPLLEAKVNEAIDTAQRGEWAEDSFVELKAKLPGPPDKSARQLAGLANAARGESPIWIVGVTEDGNVLGAKEDDFERWRADLESWFDQRHMPRVDVMVGVPREGKTVLGIQWATDHPPYVVRIGQGRAKERDVPWREGRDTRSANRPELLKLLTRRVAAPHVEVYEAVATMNSSERVHLAMSLQVVPRTDERATIADHKSKMKLLLPGVEDPLVSPPSEGELGSPVRISRQGRGDSEKTITVNVPLLLTFEAIVRIDPSQIMLLRSVEGPTLSLRVGYLEPWQEDEVVQVKLPAPREFKLPMRLSYEAYPQ